MPSRDSAVPRVYEIGDPLPPCKNGTQHRIAVPDFRSTPEDFVIGSCLRCGAQKKYPKNPDIRLIKGNKRPSS